MPALEEPVVMGVVNVTPDSFSDGGRWPDTGLGRGPRPPAARPGRRLLDVGGESTRPGPTRWTPRRSAPRRPGGGRPRARAGARVSIDTMKLAVAEPALAAGATYVNDVTAFRHDPELAGLVADRGADCCLMHMLGEPRTMQRDPRYRDVVDDVKAFLLDRWSSRWPRGSGRTASSSTPASASARPWSTTCGCSRASEELVALGFPVVVGTSRKSFLGRLTGRREPAARVAATVATTVMAFERGARVFRVHDVAETVDALAVAAATLRAHGA
jgi:dihydropteroate synthase